MSNITDVMICIDTTALPSLSKNKDKPTTGLNKYVYMIVTKDKIIAGNAGAELNISANIGDNVRWRATSLSGDFENSVMLYNFKASKGGDLLTTPLLIGGENNGKVYKKFEEAPTQGKMPLSGTRVETPYNYFQSTVESQGKVTYQWYFQVNKSSDGSLVGYGMWDPYITISN